MSHLLCAEQRVREANRQTNPEIGTKNEGEWYAEAQAKRKADMLSRTFF